VSGNAATINWKPVNVDLTEPVISDFSFSYNGYQAISTNVDVTVLFFDNGAGATNFMLTQRAAYIAKTITGETLTINIPTATGGPGSVVLQISSIPDNISSVATVDVWLVNDIGVAATKSAIGTMNIDTVIPTAQVPAIPLTWTITTNLNTITVNFSEGVTTPSPQILISYLGLGSEIVATGGYGTWSNNEQTWVINNIALTTNYEGVATINLSGVKDLMGHVMTANSDLATFNMDSKPPQATTFSVSQAIITNNFSVTMSFSDANTLNATTPNIALAMGGLIVSLNDSVVSYNPTSKLLSITKTGFSIYNSYEGGASINAYIMDSKGNVATTSWQPVTVDLTAPWVSTNYTVNYQPGLIAVSGSALVTLNLYDNVSGLGAASPNLELVAVTVNGGTVTVGMSVLSYNIVSGILQAGVNNLPASINGVATVNLLAINAQGVQVTRSSVATINIDTYLPSASVTVSNTVVSTSIAVVTVNFSETMVTGSFILEMQYDSGSDITASTRGTWSNNDQTWVVNNLQLTANYNGTATLNIFRATDKAGNSLTLTSNFVTFNVEGDTTPP
ncbi:hypothetical protein ACFL4D_03200, partial [Candidatus Margulisiibacteriota bacterium]